MRTRKRRDVPWAPPAEPFHLARLQHADRPQAPAIDFVAEHESLASAWAECPRADLMLTMLENAIGAGLIEASYDRELRLFAVWSARAAIHNSAREAAKRFLAGNAAWSEVVAARRELGSTACAAGVVGLRVGDPRAARVLAGFHTANPKALEGAKWSAFYAIRALLMAEAERRAPLRFNERKMIVGHEVYRSVRYVAEHPDVMQQIDAGESAAQAETLRVLIGNPFNGEPCQPNPESIDQLLRPAPPVRPWKPKPPAPRPKFDWTRFNKHRLKKLGLTPRQLQIVKAIIKHQSTRKAAVALGLSRLHVGDVWKMARWIGQPDRSTR
jgi:hypothetical protein